MMNDSEDEHTENTDQPVSSIETEPTNTDLGPTHTGFEREDNRWVHRASRRDWWILLLMIVTYLVWTGIIYLLEPGIR